jgi:hypothetical protein
VTLRTKRWLFACGVTLAAVVVGLLTGLPWVGGAVGCFIASRGAAVYIFPDPPTPFEYEDEGEPAGA